MAKFITDWTKVDWRLQDVVIAESTGRTRERVRQARQQFAGGRRAELHRKLTGATARARLTAMVTEDRTLPDLAKLAGCSVSNVSQVLRDLGKGFRRRPGSISRYDWTRIPQDWASRTDRELAVIVGAVNPAVVTQWRRRHRMSRRG